MARTIRCATAICTAMARSATAMSPEIAACAKLATGIEAEIQFRASFGPIRARHPCHGAGQSEEAHQQCAGTRGAAGYYRDCPFVRVVQAAPRVKDVAASNYANLSAVSNGRSIAVMAVLDNLNKGAAGGGMQWMNRLLGFDETTGLTAPAPGWT